MARLRHVSIKTQKELTAASAIIDDMVSNLDIGSASMTKADLIVIQEIIIETKQSLNALKDRIDAEIELR